MQRREKAQGSKLGSECCYAAMSAQGATLQNYNNELVKCIEDLREKREELNKQIMKEEEDKGRPLGEPAAWTAPREELQSVAWGC